MITSNAKIFPFNRVCLVLPTIENTYLGQIIDAKIDTRKESGDKRRSNPPFFKVNSRSLATYGRNVEDVSNELKNKNFVCVLCKGTTILNGIISFSEPSIERRSGKVQTRLSCCCRLPKRTPSFIPLIWSEVKPPQADNCAGFREKQVIKICTISRTSYMRDMCNKFVISLLWFCGVQVKVSSTYGNRVIETYACLVSE